MVLLTSAITIGRRSFSLLADRTIGTMLRLS